MMRRNLGAEDPRCNRHIAGSMVGGPHTPPRMDGGDVFVSTFAWLIPAILVPAILAGFDAYPRLDPRRQRWLLTVTRLLSVGAGAGIVLLVVFNTLAPREWDFLAFWVPARAAALGFNFYEPASLHVAASTATYSPGFVQQILDVGFWYPPVTMLLFLPLGYLTPPIAGAWWGAVNLFFLAGAIVVLARLFRPAPDGSTYLLTAAMLLPLRGTVAALYLAQTNLMLVVTVALYWKHRRSWRGGAYAMLGAAVKPLGAFFLLQPVIQRSWRVLGGAFLALVLLGAATLARFGWTITSSYFTTNISARLPHFVYTEQVNQSLLAAIMRARGDSPPPGSPLSDPVYVAVALILVGITAWLVYRLGERYADYGFALLVPCGLVVYPASLAHYSVLLILPMLHLWRHRQETAGGPIAAILVISAAYAISWAQSGDLTLFANLLVWLWLVAQSFHLIWRWGGLSREERPALAKASSAALTP